MTSQVAGGEAIFEEKCVFFPFLREKSTKCGQNMFNYVTFLMFSKKNFVFLLLLSNSQFW